MSVNHDLKDEVKGMVLSVKDLPTLPTVLTEVSKLVEDPNSTTDQVAVLIAMDQVLSAKVLKMVNSPIYGFPGRIGTVKHALVLLGFNVIRGIIISTSVFDIMTKSMVGMWEHSVGCALACGALARAAQFKDPDEYSVAGLLHDLGKVVATLQFPAMKKDIEELVASRDLTYFEAEKELYGFAHDRINIWLADHWHLPPNIKEGMGYHHKPRSAQLYPAMAAVVHLGDFLIRLLEHGSGGDDNVPYLDPDALRITKLKVKDLEGVLDFVTGQLGKMSNLNFG